MLTFLIIVLTVVWFQSGHHYILSTFSKPNFPYIHPPPPPPSYLSVEGDHGMGCIAQNHRRRPHVVGKALYAHQRQRPVAKIIRYEALLPNQRDGVAKVLLKEGQQHRRVAQRRKLRRRHKQRDGKGAVLIGQPDHHKLAARPDVQLVGRHLVAVVAGRGAAVVSGCRGQAELHVGVRNVLLAEVEARSFHHLFAHGGVGAVASNNQVRTDHDLRIIKRQSTVYHNSPHTTCALKRQFITTSLI